MFISWFNVAGMAFRILPNVFSKWEEFTCFTYSVYKPIVTTDTPLDVGDINNLTPLPMHDPKFPGSRFSMGVVEWSLLTLSSPAFLAIACGCLCSFC